MTPEDWHKIKELCRLALEQPPELRSAFLAQACPDDELLRREVESMIAGATVGELDAPVWKNLGDSATAGTVSSDRTERRIPATLGRYRVLHLVGEGGMGAVYKVEQERPHRIVALKVIKPGLATPELLRRFERESEALARLHHPGIAQIYEVGTADEGSGPLPYFAMEFINGVPLRDYAELHRLNTHQRLELMAKVCDAVEHAHQRGIIHRDLKPSNILMDEAGQPKILDFGVARVTDSDGHATRQTDLGQLLGTLAYMSPEQVLADPLELDTRSDVYALGVILYELLASRLPYQLSTKLLEAARTIREQDPARLSSISRVYRGDVETIVAKALEKDKTRRYSSAAALAADMRRYLADEPIAARPASTGYQLQKFARRHKALVTATAVVFAVLVVGIAVSTREAVKARQAEQTAQAVNDFLRNDLLAQASAATQSGPSTKPDPDLKVRTALDRAAARITGKFDRQPEVEAAIRDTIGQTYMDLGLYPEARTQLERALDLHRRVLGAENPETLTTISRLGRAAFLQGKYTEAEALSNQTMEVQRRVLGPEHPDTLASMTVLANVYDAQGKYAQAEALDSRILEIRRRVLGPEHPDTLTSMHNLALVYGEQRKYTQAEALHSQALEIRRRVLGAEHPNTLSSINQLAIVYFQEGNYPQAEGLYSQALEIRRRVLGPEHPYTLAFLADFTSMYQRQGNYALAENYAAQALAGRRNALGSDNEDTMSSATDLALAYQSQGKFAESEPLAREALEFDRKKEPDRWQRFRVESLLGASLAGQKKYAEAEPLLLEGYQGMAERKDRIGVPNWYHLDHAGEWIVQLYQAWDKPDKAAEWRQRLADSIRSAKAQ